MKKILMWILTVFMALAAIAYFPSAASIIAIIFAVIAAPVKPLQEFFSDHGLRGFTKGLVLCIAFIGAVMTAPSTPSADNASQSSPPVRSASVETVSPSQDAEPSQTPDPTPKPSLAPETTSTAPTPQPTQTPAPAASPDPTPTPDPTPQPTPSPDPTPEPAPASAAPAQSGDGGTSGGNGGTSGNGDNFNTWDNPSQQQTSQSWVLNTNTMKIHYPSCSSVARIAPRNYSTSNASLNELLNRGYSRCGRCF